MKKISLSIFCAILILLSAVSAKAQSSDISLVIQQISSGNGPITQAEYDKFWSAIGMTKPEDRMVVINAMKRNLILTQEYQVEIWRCAEFAWQNRVVPACPKADVKFKILQAEMRKINQESSLKSIEDSSRNLLQAAAKRESMKGPNGVVVSLTLDMIRATKVSMDRMLARFSQLLRPQF